MQEKQAALANVDKLSMEEIRALAEQALKVIPERAKYYAEKLGVTYGRITIRNQRSRWGSCNQKRNLNFNCLLMLEPVQYLKIIWFSQCFMKISMHLNFLGRQRDVSSVFKKILNRLLGPNKKYYKDDNYQRAQNITSMFPLYYRPEQPEQPEDLKQRNIECQQRQQYEIWHRQTGDGLNNRNRDRRDYGYNTRDRYYKNRASLPIRNIIPTRPIRTDFTEKEKAEILSRVMFVGIERAAMEAGTSKEIVMNWLQLIDESISEINAEWDALEAQGGIAGYEIDYERVIERRNHYKKPLEQIITILMRAKEVGTKQAARELRSTRNEIIRWQRLFPKQIWEQIRQWAKENRENKANRENSKNNRNTDDNAAGHENISDISAQYSSAQHSLYGPYGQNGKHRKHGHDGQPEELSLPDPETIIARAEEVGDEQAAHEFRVSIITVKSLRRRANQPPASEIKHYTREERISILDRADEIGLKKTSIEAGISASCICQWRKELGRNKYVICTMEEKDKILDRADEVGRKQAAAEFKVNSATIGEWRRKAGRQKQRKHTEEEKTIILARADEVGAKQAAIEFKINAGTVSDWRKAAGRLKVKKTYSDEERTAVVARSNKVGINQAAEESGISPHTIVLWRSKSSIAKRRKMLNAEERFEIWTRANEVGRLQAANEYGISPVTIENWSWKFGMKTPPIHGVHGVSGVHGHGVCSEKTY